MPQNLVGRHINNDLARTFRAIVDAGWANKSDGDVEAPTGHFAFVSIAPNELSELLDAIGHHESFGPPMPGVYLVIEDSDGNTTLLEYYVESGAKMAFNMMAREYAIWNANCPNCGDEGPYDRLHGNVHKCSCGWAWDPTSYADLLD